jgi:hypothetical protein
MCDTLFEAIGLCVFPDGLSITLLVYVSLTNKTLDAARRQALGRSQTIKFTLPQLKNSRSMTFCPFVSASSMFHSLTTKEHSSISSDSPFVGQFPSNRVFWNSYRSAAIGGKLEVQVLARLSEPQYELPCLCKVNPTQLSWINRLCNHRFILRNGGERQAKNTCAAIRELIDLISQDRVREIDVLGKLHNFGGLFIFNL